MCSEFVVEGMQFVSFVWVDMLCKRMECVCIFILFVMCEVSMVAGNQTHTDYQLLTTHFNSYFKITFK